MKYMDISRIIDFHSVVSNDWFIKTVKAIVIVIVGYLLGRFIPLLAKRLIVNKFEQRIVKFVQKLLLYIIVTVSVIVLLRTLNVEISTLLATAGLLSIAVGFAAQTAFSNLISGMLLYSEKPFVIGDIIEVDNNVGFVMSIDLLSTKIRTFDNLFIRIPNAFIIDKAVKNYTKFPVRRLGISVSISISSDLGVARSAVEESLASCRVILTEPEPKVVVESFNESGICLKVFCWIEKSDYYDGLTELMTVTKKALDGAGIEILFPQRFITFTDDSEKVMKTYLSKKDD
jgi:small-conductance mechanosensitive channel